MLQKTQTFFHNLQTELMAASLVSEHVRQSLVADSGPESAALSSQSLLESDSLPLWLASSLLTSESLSQFMVLPEASAVNLSLGSAAALDWTGGKTDGLRLWMFWAVAGYQLDGQSTATTANVAFLSASMGPLSALMFRCAARGVVPFLVLETEDEC